MFLLNVQNIAFHRIPLIEFQSHIQIETHRGVNIVLFSRMLRSNPFGNVGSLCSGAYLLLVFTIRIFKQFIYLPNPEL